jgi:phospholipid transport system transporter-binding protein
VSRATLQALGAGRFSLSGNLDAVTVIDILAASTKQFAGATQIEIDCQGVTDADSSGLALLLEWLRQSRIREQTVRFLNLPPQISALARISEVEDLFGVSDEPATAPVQSGATA